MISSGRPPPESVPASCFFARRGKSSNTLSIVCFIFTRARASVAPVGKFSVTVKVGKSWRPSGNLTDAEIADLVRIQAGDIPFGKNNPAAARSFDIGDGADQR